MLFALIAILFLSGVLVWMESFFYGALGTVVFAGALYLLIGLLYMGSALLQSDREARRYMFQAWYTRPWSMALLWPISFYKVARERD